MTTTPGVDTGPSTDRRFFGHPLALGSLFSVELWERSSFYGMQAVMAYYLYYAVDPAGDARGAVSPPPRRGMLGG